MAKEFRQNCAMCIIIIIIFYYFFFFPAYYRLTCVRDEPVSNFGQDSVFSQSLSRNASTAV